MLVQKQVLSFLFSIILLFTLCSFAFAETTSPQNDKTKSTDDPVTFSIPDSYRGRKILLFPFDLPGYIMRAVTWPLGAIAQTIEQKQFGKRVFDLLSNKKHTFWVYPYIDGAPGPGFGGGLGFVHKDLFHQKWKANGRYDIHINLNQFARFAIEQNQLFDIYGKWLSFRLESFWAHENNNDYYGIGANSKRSKQATYSSDFLTARAKFDYELPKKLHGGLRVGTLMAKTRSVAKGGNPSVSQLFSPAEMVGLGDNLLYFVPGVEFWYDSRDNNKFPNHGGYYLGSFNYYKATNATNMDYNQYQLNLTHFIPLWRPGIVLTLQNKWMIKQKIGSSKIPFELLSVLDYTSPLRGFSRGRFHDRSSVLFNVEYRYPIWKVIDGVIFFDTGRVFRRLRDFAFSDFKFDGGGGLRFRYLDLALFNVDVAYGGEGIKIMFGITKLL